MDYQIETCFKEYCKVSDTCTDWLIKSWCLEDEDKVIALAFYRKADKIRNGLAKRLSEIVDNKYGRNNT